jgi:AcrR family transcriptional regulator
MPRNKRPQEREAKRGEIVAAARALFLERGFEATPLSAIAKAAGVTPNTIYWYFADKDALLIAVLDELLLESWTAYQGHVEATADDVDLLAWVVDGFRDLRLLISEIHARIDVSPALNAWHDRFHAASEGLLAHELRERGVPQSALEPTVKIAVFVIEGLITHALEPARAREILQTLVAGMPTA